MRLNRFPEVPNLGSDKYSNESTTDGRVWDTRRGKSRRIEDSCTGVFYRYYSKLKTFKNLSFCYRRKKLWTFLRLH